MAFFGGNRNSRLMQQKIKEAEIQNEDPQKSYMWEIDVRDREGNGKSVKFYAKTTAIPAIITEPIKNYICGTEYQYAGRDVSPRILRITLFDNEKMENSLFFDYWRLLSNEGKTNRKVIPAYYLRDVRVKLQDSEGNDSLIYIFSNCYPLEIGEMALSYSESSEITFDVLLAFQHRYVQGIKSEWYKPEFGVWLNGKQIFKDLFN